jgi:hypothetical protein
LRKEDHNFRSRNYSCIQPDKQLGKKYAHEREREREREREEGREFTIEWPRSPSWVGGVRYSPIV